MPHVPYDTLHALCLHDVMARVAASHMRYQRGGVMISVKPVPRILCDLVHLTMKVIPLRCHVLCCYHQDLFSRGRIQLTRLSQDLQAKLSMC